MKPGVSIDQARTAMATPYRTIVNDVEAPLQIGMGPQTLARSPPASSPPTARRRWIP